ncbi:MAG: hypothetical protein ACLRIP_12490 [Blautia massiliensis (ex Durand et al. 2017)]
MLTREATYEDYGFSEDEDKRLGEFCKNLEMWDKILLLQCAAEVYPNIVDELYCCIVIGMSYDKMNKKKFVALDRKDFYAYRKKTLAVFREALKACNRISVLKSKRNRSQASIDEHPENFYGK